MRLVAFLGRLYGRFLAYRINMKIDRRLSKSELKDQGLSETGVKKIFVAMIPVAIGVLLGVTIAKRITDKVKIKQ